MTEKAFKHALILPENALFKNYLTLLWLLNKDFVHSLAYIYLTLRTLQLNYYLTALCKLNICILSIII